MIMPDRIKLPHAFWLGVDSLGIKRSQLIKQADLSLSVANGQAKVSTTQFFSLWTALEQLNGPDAGAALALSIDRAVLPPSFLVAYHAKNFRDALQRVTRFKSLCAPEELKTALDGNFTKVFLHWPFGDSQSPQSLTDATFISIMALGRHGTGQDLCHTKLELRRSKSELIAEYFQCPIKWNASQDILYLSNKELDLPFSHYNEELTTLLDKALAEALDQQRSNSSFSDKVRWLLKKCLTAGRPELKSIARELAISERSLQRHLSEEGGSFQSILSDTRHGLALDYLRDATYELSEIAFLLGYEDQASFYRSFQHWEQLSPAKWREQHQQTAHD